MVEWNHNIMFYESRIIYIKIKLQHYSKDISFRLCFSRMDEHTQTHTHITDWPCLKVKVAYLPIGLSARH